jgi:hypothetical protein
MKPAAALSNAEWRRVLLEHIRHQYRQLIERSGKQPGEMIPVPEVVLPPLRGRFTHLSHDNLYRPMSHGSAYLLLGGLSADQMEILLTSLNQLPVP